MSPAELESATGAAWRYAYSWRGIARRLARTAAPWPVAVLTNLGYRHYAHNLDRFYTCGSGMAAAPWAAFAPRAGRGTAVPVTAASGRRTR